MSAGDPYHDWLAIKLEVSPDRMRRACEAAGVQVVVKEKDRGDGRKAHYGEGQQPVDTIRRLGWGPHFYAGNVLKYLRRSKSAEHSRESARVYFGWLREGAEAGEPGHVDAYHVLLDELTGLELAIARGDA